ncbi:MAG: hypothetical protein ACR2LN_00935 [Candidatus Levyibacteriota bacterium]
MTAQAYIIATIQQLTQPLPQEELGDTKLEDAIYAKVMSKKFRKFRIDELTIANTKKVIALAVKYNKPIIISQLFGGNKLWRFDEAPEIDWSELFSIIYLIHWMKSIASVYKPGAHLDFYSQDISIESLNNVPRSETKRYSETFKAMLDWLKPYIPKNVTVTYRRQADEYNNPDQYLKELEEAKAFLLKSSNGKLPQMNDKQKATTELNVKLRQGQADDPQWREKVELEHQAIFLTKSLLPYLKDPRLIRISSAPFSGFIAVGSSKNSVAKFWASVGALQSSGDSFAKRVLTPKQLQSATFDWQEIRIDGLEGGNFRRVRVLKPSFS